MWILLSFCLLAKTPDTMLSQADAITKKYNLEVAKTLPPSNFPQTQSCLDTAAVWFTIDLEELEAPAFEMLKNEMVWDYLREVGVEGAYLKGLKKGGAFRTGLGLDPLWGSDWDEVAIAMQKKGIALIGDALGNSTGLSADFWLALKNVGDYPGLYHLVEVDKRDWKWLPNVGAGRFATNVPWLSLQELQKKGYVPEQFAPYVKESRWNATAQVQGADGLVRRWLYLKTNEWDPVIDWLNPSFAGLRIAAADALDSVYRLGEKIIRLDATLSNNAKETLSLWIRKLGGFVVQEGRGGIEDLKSASADLISDTLTRPALLHALLAKDTEALKLMYRVFLEEGIETKRLVHSLQPFDEYTCDWAALAGWKKKFQYYDEILTADALRTRLMKEDMASLGEGRTWPARCALGLQDLEKRREDITDTHLLLAFFYAMQPGAFSFSVSDLLGMVTKQTVRLLQPNENILYASLPGQFTNEKSFALQLKKMLTVRRENEFQHAELISVPRTEQPGLIVLVHRLKKGMNQVLAVNFGNETALQTVEMPCFRQTTAIDLMTGLAEKKPLDSPTLRLAIPPLTGKVILFQPQYYD